MESRTGKNGERQSLKTFLLSKYSYLYLFSFTLVFLNNTKRIQTLEHPSIASSNRLFKVKGFSAMSACCQNIIRKKRNTM